MSIRIRVGVIKSIKRKKTFKVRRGFKNKTQKWSIDFNEKGTYIYIYIYRVQDS